ncbi:MAG: hypothetical protein AAGK97_01065 [Bacteroidota bacterium]
MDAKTKAIVAHITLIGWIIALVVNGQQKDEFSSFYIRQMLGLIILGFVGSWIPFVNFLVWPVMLVFWILSLIGAANGEEKPTPILGEQFQQWFKGL